METNRKPHLIWLKDKISLFRNAPRDFMGLKFPYASKEKKIIGPEFLSLKGGFSFLPWSKVPLPSERQLYDHKTNV